MRLKRLLPANLSEQIQKFLFKKDSFLSSVLKSQGGFNMVGVVVSSSIGLILMTGLQQMLSNMSYALKEIDDRSKRVILGQRITDDLFSKICDGIPAEKIDELLRGEDSKIYPHEFTTDFPNEDELRTQYGIYGDNYINLKGDRAESCQGVSGECQQVWTMELVTQRKTQGVYVYNKPYYFAFRVLWEDPSTSAEEYTCDKSSAPVDSDPGDGSGGSIDTNCITLEGAGTKRTLFGCGGTQNLGGEEIIAVGYDLSLKSLSGKGQAFIGYQAGNGATVSGISNSFFSAQAGRESTVSGISNSFFGSYAGKESAVSGINNDFFGSYSGMESAVSGQGNSFTGYYSGKESAVSGRGNSLLGYYSGKESAVSGTGNTFLGDHSGREATVSGEGNSFLGMESGKESTVPRHGNVLIGTHAGIESEIKADHNVLIGYKAGVDLNIRGGGKNVFIGSYAGDSAEFDSDEEVGHNTFIGYKAGHEMDIEVSRITNISDRIIMQTENNPNDLHSSLYDSALGDNTVLIAGTLKLCTAAGTSCIEVPRTASSREYKRDIKAFDKFEKALQDIVQTPLFNYRYKEEYGEHPEKERLGVIAEELPKHLQIEREVIQPDWISIQGTVWAGIKALYIHFMDLKTDFTEKLADLKKLWSHQLGSLRKELMREIDQVRKQKISQVKKFNQQLSRVKFSLSQSQRQLAETKVELERLKKEMRELKRTLRHGKNK